MKTEKIIVLLLSFALFAAGVWALYSLHGTVRVIVLAASFVTLTGIAVRQTLVRAKRNERTGKEKK